MTSCLSAYPDPHPLGLLRRHHFKEYIQHPHSNIPIYVYYKSSLIDCSDSSGTSSKSIQTIIHETDDSIEHGTDVALDSIIDSLLMDTPDTNKMEFPIEDEETLDAAVDTYIDSLLRIEDDDESQGSTNYSSVRSLSDTVDAPQSEETVSSADAAIESDSAASIESEAAVAAEAPDAPTASPDSIDIRLQTLDLAPKVQYLYNYPTKKVVRSYIIRNQIVYIVRDFATGIVSVVRKAIR